MNTFVFPTALHCFFFFSQVKLSEPLTVAKFASINDLLIAVEKEMKKTLAKLLSQCIGEAEGFTADINKEPYLAWVDKFPVQIVLVAAQVLWSQATEDAIKKMGGDGSGSKFQLPVIQKIEESIEAILNILADSVLDDHPPIVRKKLENLVRYRIFLHFDASLRIIDDLLLNFRFYRIPFKPAASKCLQLFHNFSQIWLWVVRVEILS